MLRYRTDDGCAAVLAAAGPPYTSSTSSRSRTPLVGTWSVRRSSCIRCCAGACRARTAKSAIKRRWQPQRTASPQGPGRRAAGPLGHQPLRRAVARRAAEPAPMPGGSPWFRPRRRQSLSSRVDRIAAQHAVGRHAAMEALGLEPGRSANKRLQELAAHLPDRTVTAERTRAMAAFPPSSKPAEVLPFEGAWAPLAGAPRPWSSTAQRGCGDASGRRPAPRATSDCCSAPAGRPEGKPAHNRIAQWARRCHHVVVRHPCRDGTRAWVQLPWNTRRDPLPRGQLRSWRRHRTTSRLKSAHHRPGRPGRCCSHARVWNQQGAALHSVCESDKKD